MSATTAAARPELLGRPVAGDGMLRPMALAAVAVLVVNDHLFKGAAPGLVTGKVSDVAGLVFFPILLVAAWEVVCSLAWRWKGPSATAVTVAVATTGLAFAAVKVTPLGEAIYETALGALQWPFATLGDLVAAHPVDDPRPVEVVRDPTDLVALAALWVPHAIGRARAGERSDTRMRAYDLAVALLSVALLAGATLDGWAHTHDLLALEAILTPWHAVIYVAFVLVAAVLLGPPLLAVLEGRTAHLAIPAGYGSSVVGLVAFTLVGVADLGWHVAFGIEADAEALLSPTHLSLGVGAMLIATGPLRAAWLRDDEPAWPAFLPAALSTVAIVGIAAFALHVANLFVDPWPRYPYELSDVTWYGPHIGVASAIVPTVVLAVPTLVILQRWRRPPAGTMTLLVGGTMGGLTFLHDGPELVGAPVLGGFLADLLLLALRPGDGGWRLGAMLFLAPAAVLCAYFLVLNATGPVTWSAHLIGGTVALAGGTGLAVALPTLVAGMGPTSPR